MKRLTDAELDDLLADPKVREAMRLRCEEEQHDYQPGITAWFSYRETCRWCGARDR